MKDCNCLTVKRYDGEYHCMECYALFVPAPPGGEVKIYGPKHATKPGEYEFAPAGEPVVDTIEARLDALECFAGGLASVYPDLLVTWEDAFK